MRGVRGVSGQMRSERGSIQGYEKITREVPRTEYWHYM
jgi:hypothetical protein